jgi:pilus assembly protein Flp/PilA
MGQRLDRGQSMRTGLRKLLRDKRGATAIEYGLIAALVVLGAFLGLKNFATTSVNMWNNVSNTVAKS